MTTSPGEVFARHYFDSRDVAAAIAAAGLSTGDVGRDVEKGLHYLRSPWCQSYLISLYKETYGDPDIDGRQLSEEALDELVASTAEVKRTLTLLLRDPGTSAKDKVAAARALEEIRAGERVPPRQEDVANKIKDALGIPR